MRAAAATPGTPAPGAATASEVELGYHAGGPLVRDRRQGMDLFNRAPLEFEDEVAILDDVVGCPAIDPTASATSA